MIDSSGWRSHQAGHFPGGGAARGDDPAHCTLRWDIPSTGFSSQLVLLIALHAPASMNGMSNGKCDFRQTRAAGRVLDLLVASARPISWRHEERAERTAQPHRPLETSPSSKLELRPRINGEEDEDGQAHEDPPKTTSQVEMAAVSFSCSPGSRSVLRMVRPGSTTDGCQGSAQTVVPCLHRLQSGGAQCRIHLCVLRTLVGFANSAASQQTAAQPR